jgi:hypothetical protein
VQAAHSFRSSVSVAEEELDELSVHVSRHRPEELTKLAKSTKFTRKEIQLIYRGFKQVRHCRPLPHLTRCCMSCVD